MKSLKKGFIEHLANIITIALIVECFLCAMMAVRKYAREDCYQKIAETTAQTVQMFEDELDDGQEQLQIFADLLGTNKKYADATAKSDSQKDESIIAQRDLAQMYMKEFCETEYFDFLFLYRHGYEGEDAYVGNPGAKFHEEVTDFAREVDRAPYISEVVFKEEAPTEKYIYQTVVVHSGETPVGLLYGYTSLENFTSFVSSTAYGGKCKFAIVDGDNGSFLLDDLHETAGNLYTSDLSKNGKIKKGYGIEKLRDDVRNGKSGYFVFKPKKVDWQYTYYMPLGMNNWSMLLTIDEGSAFAAYENVANTVIILMVVVVALMIMHVVILMRQNSVINKRDEENLNKSSYINSVQRALINAHNNPDFVEQSLQIVAATVEAETVMLLTFTDRKISNAYYWPSVDKPSALELIGKNIREDFPMLFDALAARRSVIYDRNAEENIDLSEATEMLFVNLEIENAMLTPIMDNAGMLKGAIAAVNMVNVRHDASLLECVSYDFFMAIANLESHNIIKNMGMMDYLTGVKNRNSYESELADYATRGGDTLWCVFVDINGLHEINNEKGHKAGDALICAVAASIKRAFGEKDTYRLGGDEFVSFVVDGSYDELHKKKKIILAELAAQGYYVSIGFEGVAKNENELFDVERVIGNAEAIMYLDKKEYYEKMGISYSRDRVDKEKK